jgi:hypothetical protein
MTHERLKITASIQGNIIINNEMFFDGILYFAKRNQDTDYYNLPRFAPKKQNLSVKLPLKKSQQVYLASRAYYRVIKEYNDFYHRRFNEVDAVRFMEKKRVYLDQKTTKNFRKPNKVFCLKNNEVWWYVIGDREEIQALLKNIKGIGKENGQGYGLVTGWKIETTNKKGSRLFPSKDGKLFKTVFPPYANIKNKRNCYIKRF